jgi:uncharacterized SAM-binding protein YcdF (DUF218 family)
MFADPAVSAALSKSAFAFLLMAIIALAAAVFIRALVAAIGWANARIAAPKAAPKPASAPAPAPIPAGPTPQVVAAISAAVTAAIGPSRIVWISESAGDAPLAGGHAAGWSAQTRARHHGSHDPHHTH